MCTDFIQIQIQIQIQKLYFLSNMFKHIQHKLCRAFISTNKSINNKGTNITVHAKHKNSQ